MRCHWLHQGLSGIVGLAMIGTVTPSIAIASQPPQPIRLAQLFYPPASSQKMVRVIGQGTVRQAADLAEIQILVEPQESFEDSAPYEEPSDDFSVPIPEPDTRETLQSFDSPRLAFGNTGELSETDMMPLVNAIVQSGASRKDISVKISKSRPSMSPFPLPSLGNAGASFVLVKVRNPTPNSIESVVVAAEDHLQQSQTLSLDDVKVNYKLNDCEQLKLQAFEVAVTDAQKRAEAIAGAMKAKLSASASVAEPFFNMFVPGCESGKGFSLSGKRSTRYEPGDPIEVVVDRIIFFTYTIEE